MREKELLLLSNSKGPLFEPFVTLKCYPIEFIFAEKLETLIYRGSENSRMKDYHDLYTLAASEKILNRENLAKAIRLVFEHRKTPFQLPIQFDSIAVEALQEYWKRYQKTALTRLSDQIAKVIEVINQVLDQSLF